MRILVACLALAYPSITLAAEGSKVTTGEGFGTSRPQACERAIAAAKATAIGAVVLSTSCECEKQKDGNVNCRAEVRIKD